MKDTTSSIFHSAKKFFTGTLLSRVTGMLRDMAMAFAFGTQGLVAGFMVAFRFSHLLRRLLGEGALQTAFIPHFEELRRSNPDHAYSFFRDLYGSLSILLLILIIAISTVLGFVVDYIPTSYQEIASLTLLMMPSLLFICLFGLNASLLQCERRFFISSAAPAAFNIVWIAGVLLVYWQQPIAPMKWLSLAVIAACLCQWLITLPSTYTFVRQAKLSSFSLFSSQVRKLAFPLLCGVIGVGAAQINNALDALFARFADAEGPAYLWYAIRIQQLPLALFGIAISSALLPPLARAIKGGDVQSYQHFIETALKQSIVLMLPMMIGLFVLGDSCINVIYGRGNFTHASVTGTTECLWAYALGLLPMALVLIYAPAFYAQGNYRIPTLASTLSVGLSIGLNAFLIGWMGYGATSVALATSLSAWFNLALLAVQLNIKPSKDVYLQLTKSFFGSFLAGGTVLALRWFIWEDILVWQVLLGQEVEYPRHFMQQAMPLAIQGSAFALVYFIFLPQRHRTTEKIPFWENP